jgi:putative zinc finger/helix-turn-helix YgiT family protein
MNNQLSNCSSTATAACPSCGSLSLKSRAHAESFEYGDGADAATLTAQILLHECQNCGMVFSCEDASEKRHEAVCAHLGVFNPNQVRGIRERYGLSQAEFSDITCIGKASLARWESGALIQNFANDKFLFLLTYSDNFLRLGGKSPTRASVGAGPELGKRFGRFREISQNEVPAVVAIGAHFSLQPITV